MSKRTRPSMVEDHWPEGDARTLADHHVITNDPARHKAAVKAAQKMADEKTAEAEAMRRVASHPIGGEKKSKKGLEGVTIIDSRVRKI